MRKRTLLFTVAVMLAVGGVVAMKRDVWWPGGAGVAQSPAQAQNAPRSVPVEVAIAEKKQLPVRVEALGTVTPMASVAIKSRLETEIVGVHFTDGARVKQGDLLFTLDSRTIEAQIRQAEATIARDKAQLEGAERDMRRYTELVAKGATAITNLDNAKTQAAMFSAAMRVNEALLDNLRVQLSYATIRAPISGRVGTATVKVGNFVRPADATPLVTINQMAPVYVSFAVPQRVLPELRQALAEKSGTVEAILPGTSKNAAGQVSMIENNVDAATGMVMVRATMPNTEELLWPGTLVTAQMTLRMEEAVSVPSRAVQVSQSGSYVFVVENGTAQVRPVKVARTLGIDSVIEEGLAGGETVVTNGQLLLSNGTRVAPQEAKAGT
jgi:membrane fusion protein, multidrug efflux system